MHLDFSGTEHVAVSIAKTWSYLADVHKVAACIHGIQDLEEVEPEHWQARIAVGIGLLKAKFTLEVTRPEIRPQEHMTVIVRGKAPGSSFELVGRIRLAELASEQTEMHWSADTHINGAVAAAGGRIIQSTAEKITKDYFACLKTNLQTEAAETSQE